MPAFRVSEISGTQSGTLHQRRPGYRLSRCALGRHDNGCSRSAAPAPPCSWVRRLYSRPIRRG